MISRFAWTACIGLFACASAEHSEIVRSPATVTTTTATTTAHGASEPHDDSGAQDAALLAKAAALYAKDCSAGNANACYQAGIAYREGAGIIKDNAKANAAFRMACAKHVAEACNDLGAQIEGGHDRLPIDYPAAFAAYKQACEWGHMWSCANLGSMMEHGLGTAEDPMAAKKLYEKSCAADVGNGCVLLGLLLESGRVGERPKATYPLYEKACALGLADGCTSFGVTLDNAEGIAEDAPRAASLYAKGCEGGDMHGCALLGTMYASGRGVPEDRKRAAALYKKACDADDAYGCEKLATLSQHK